MYRTTRVSQIFSRVPSEGGASSKKNKKKENAPGLPSQTATSSTPSNQERDGKHVRMTSATPLSIDRFYIRLCFALSFPFSLKPIDLSTSLLVFHPYQHQTRHPVCQTRFKNKGLGFYLQRARRLPWRLESSPFNPLNRSFRFFFLI